MKSIEPEMPSSLAISPRDYFSFINKYNEKETLGFHLQWVFEQEIYALRNANSPVRFRILAILFPSWPAPGIGHDNLIRSYAIGYDGGTITGNGTGIAGDLRITSDYQIYDYPPKDGINKLKMPSNNENLSFKIEFPKTNSPHNNHNIYWAHDVSYSEIYAVKDNKTYRVLNILIPAFVRWKNNQFPKDYPLNLLSTGYPIDGGIGPIALLNSALIDKGFTQYP